MRFNGQRNRKFDPGFVSASTGAFIPNWVSKEMGIVDVTPLLNARTQRTDPRLWPCLAMWAAVLRQAIEDLERKGVEHKAVRADAHDFIFSGDGRLEAICGALGLDPEYIRKLAASGDAQRMYKHYVRAA